MMANAILKCDIEPVMVQDNVKEGILCALRRIEEVPESVNLIDEMSKNDWENFDEKQAMLLVSDPDVEK